MQARSFAITTLIACLLTSVAAQAQFDILQRGKKLLEGLLPGAPGVGALTTEEIGAGLREALRVGTETVVGQLGRLDGFNADPAIHIPLPDNLHTVKTALSRVGMSGMLDDLELRLNRAAEVATPKAKEIFWQAITNMTWSDVQNIYDGPDDAATQYFKRTTSQPIADAMRPVVDQSLAEVGAIQAFDSVMGQYRAIPFVPDVKADLTEWALTKALDGMFHYVAKEEAAIRHEPVKRTTDLLKRVFGA